MKRAKNVIDLETKITDGLVVVGSDVHIPFQDDAAVKAFVDYCKGTQPHTIVLNGDVIDMFMLSKFTKGEGRNPLEEITMCREFLEALRKGCPKSSIYYVIGNHECVHKDTEVLTTEGWINIKDIVEQRKSVTLLNYSIEQDLIVPDKILEYIKTPQDEMIEIETRMSKQIVSKGHEVLLGNDKMTAEEIYLEQIPKLSHLIKPCALGSTLEQVYSPDEVALITWVVTDACIVQDKSCENKKRIQFKLSKPRKIEALKELLDRMEIKYSFRECKKTGFNKLQPYYIRIYGEDARRIFDLLDDNKKQFPKAFRNLQGAAFNSLINTIVITDGSSKDARNYFYSSNKSDIDIIQEVCIKNGYATKIVTKYGHGFKNSQPTMVLMFQTNYKYGAKQQSIKKNPYNDFSYCLTTGNGTLITRIDGKVAITGNCRLERYVLTKAPELASLIEDVFSIIKTDDFNIRGCASLTINDSFVCKHGTLLGNKSGLSAIKEMENAYMSGATGHTHRLCKYIARKAGRKFVWIETGCLCDMNPEYMVLPNWQQGFCTLIFKGGRLHHSSIVEIEKGKIL